MSHTTKVLLPLLAQCYNDKTKSKENNVPVFAIAQVDQKSKIGKNINGHLQVSTLKIIGFNPPSAPYTSCTNFRSWWTLTGNSLAVNQDIIEDGKPGGPLRVGDRLTTPIYPCANKGTCGGFLLSD